MGLYANGDAGKAAAIAAIKAAVDARVQTMADGTLKLDVPSLNIWLWEQALLVISQDVTAPNREAAHGVLATVNTDSNTSSLANKYAPSNWASHPEYPTTKRIASDSTFIAGASGAISAMEAMAREVENEYAAIVQTLPRVMSEAYMGGQMGAAMPPVEERIVDTRFYVYTHVNDLGEESAPSPVSEMVELDQRDAVTIAATAPPAGRNITKFRVYRSNVGTVGAAFQFIAEGPITPASWQDNVPLSAAGEVLPTTTWAEPPAGMRGLCEMHNGIFAGFFSNTTAFCEPFHAYAWPVEYQLSCAHPIIGQEAFGQTLVRLHQGGVDYIRGADPMSMSVEKDVSKQVCASARSVCKVDGGVVFASQDGLCLADGDGVKVLTQGRILRDDWQTWQPENMFCQYNEGTVYVWGSGVGGIFAIHLPTGKITSVDFNFDSGGISSVYETGKALYGVNNGKVYRLLGGPGARTATWRSKIAVLEKHAAFAWLVVESDFAAGPVTVRWFGDGVLRHEVNVASRAPVRLPPGRYLEHEIEVVSKSRWNALTMASSTAELQGL